MYNFVRSALEARYNQINTTQNSDQLFDLFVDFVYSNIEDNDESVNSLVDNYVNNWDFIRRTNETDEEWNALKYDSFFWDDTLVCKSIA